MCNKTFFFLVEQTKKEYKHVFYPFLLFFFKKKTLQHFMKTLFILLTLIYSSLAQTSIINNNTTDKNVNHYSSMMSITSGIKSFLFYVECKHAE